MFTLMYFWIAGLVLGAAAHHMSQGDKPVHNPEIAATIALSFIWPIGVPFSFWMAKRKRETRG